MSKEKSIKHQRRILVLLDAHAILHRAFHALPSFTSPQGEPTGALYGFTAVLLKIIRELKPDYLAACYDLPEPTFRHIAYEKYKIQRPKMADELVPQIEKSREILSVFKIPIFEHPGFEADDILGAIVDQLKNEQDLQIIIASGDLDTLQLVKNDEVLVYTLRKGVQDVLLYNEAAVKERFGFGPKLLPDFKGLRGDPSDNIIGVPGIGDKTAKVLVQRFGSIENIYKALKQDKLAFEKAGIKPRIIKILEDHKEDALFSKTLAEIRRDAPIAFSLENAAWRGKFDASKAKDIFQRLGFKTLIDRLP